MAARQHFLSRVSDAALWAFNPAALIKRRFDAARLPADRNQRFGGYASEVAPALDQMRSRSRAACENNPYFGAAVRALTTHLVGAEIVAASQHPDPATQTTINEAWSRFTSQCDSDGVLNMGGLQAVAVLGMIRDGEALMLMRNTPDGLRVQVLDPSQIDNAKTINLDGGAFVQSGVEFSADGRKVALWLFPQPPTNTANLNLVSQRVAIDDVIHLYEVRAPGQCRGIPWGAAAQKRAGDIDELENALLVGAKVAALTCGFVEDTLGAAGFPIEGEQNGSTLTASLEPGTLQKLGPGQSIKFTTPQQAAQGVEFLASQIRAVASAFGVPPQYIDSDYARANFSSLRSSIGVYASRLDAIVHATLRPMLLEKLWRRWITTEILSGRIEAPDFDSDPTPFFAVEFFAPAPPVADDYKAAQADVLQIQNGLKSRAQAIRERGYDPATLDAERAADAERATALGLDAPSNQPTDAEDSNSQ
ncbi:MAG: phage portal protein [Pseudomonadota bacterium]